MGSPMAKIYKIADAAAWQHAVRQGRFEGAANDLQDGFIHLSSAAQVEETARRHFAERDGLVLVAFEEKDFGSTLKWEPSRGGDLFPHVYGTLDPALALWARPMPWRGKGHVFPEGWNA